MSRPRGPECITISDSDEESDPRGPSNESANLSAPPDNYPDIKNILLAAGASNSGIQENSTRNSDSSFGRRNTDKVLESSLNFNPFALFDPAQDAMPMPDRLQLFMANVQDLNAQKLKLEASERASKEKCEEAKLQLTSATQEISKLKDTLTESEGKINQQKGTIDELKNLVDKLKKQESGDRSKLRSVTGTLVNLQQRMVQILEDTEVDVGQQEVSSTVPVCAPMELDPMSGSLAEKMLRENIQHFEKDFESKFTQIEEQDKEIKDEILKTNQMLEKIQASIMEKFQSNGQSPPQLTYESMEDQDVSEGQRTENHGQGSLRSSGRAGNNNSTKKRHRII